MAIVTSRTCDIDVKHEPADAYTFGFTEFFTADLCPACAAKLEKAQEPFTAVGVPVELRDLAKSNGAPAFSSSMVRAWLNSHGRPQNDRGRIPADDMAYYQANVGK